MGLQEELLAAPDHSDQDHRDLGGTQAEGEDEEVLLREDQMRGRQGKKTTRGKKGKGAKAAKAKGRKNGKGGKGKGTKRRSKAGHRLAVLKASPQKQSKTGDDTPPTAPVKKRAPKKATAEPHVESPAPKPKAKAKAKAKAKGNGEVDQEVQVRKAKAKASPKAKVEGSAAPAPKRRRNQSRSQPQTAPEARADLFDQSIFDSILEFAKKFDQNTSLDETKRKVKFLLGNSWCCKLNIYWSRSACGVKLLPESQKDATKSKDFAYFKFPDTYPVILSLVVAVHCAELMVTW